MSRREQQAKRRYEAVWRAAETDGFDMTVMPIGEPRAVARCASALAVHYERTARRPQHRLSKRDAESSRDVMRALTSAAQSYADHHERAEQERRRRDMDRMIQITFPDGTTELRSGWSDTDNAAPSCMTVALRWRMGKFAYIDRDPAVSGYRRELVKVYVESEAEREMREAGGEVTNG